MARDIGQRLLHDAKDGGAGRIVQPQFGFVGEDGAGDTVALGKFVAQALQCEIQAAFVEGARAQVGGDPAQRRDGREQIAFHAAEQGCAGLGQALDTRQ